MGTVRLGCAGWSINSATAHRFDGEGSHLERYARVLNAVEINSSFYRPHQAKTYARWADAVPDDFRFSVKVPRTVSHDARLAGPDAGAALQRFAAEANALGGKLGCVLLQLPPSLALSLPVADAFLHRLRDAFGCALACEARHATWFAEAGTELLRRHGVIRVQADPAAGQPGPHEATTTARYLRLHGSPKTYHSSYPGAYLEQVAARLQESVSGADAWCIFDNTAAGAAQSNALQVSDFLDGTKI